MANSLAALDAFQIDEPAAPQPAADLSALDAFEIAPKAPQEPNQPTAPADLSALDAFQIEAPTAPAPVSNAVQAAIPTLSAQPEQLSVLPEHQTPEQRLAAGRERVAALRTLPENIGVVLQEQIGRKLLDKGALAESQNRLNTVLNKIGVSLPDVLQPAKLFEEGGIKAAFRAGAGIIDLLARTKPGKERFKALAAYADELEKVFAGSEQKQQKEILDLMASGNTIDAVLAQGGKVAADVISNLALMQTVFSSLGKVTTLDSIITKLPKGSGKLAFSARQIARAAQFAGLQFATTKGTPAERAKAAMMSFLYMSTPALSGLAPSTAKAIGIDILLNSGISKFTGQYSRAFERGRKKAIRDGQQDHMLQYMLLEAMPIAGTDVGFSLLTRSAKAMQDAQRADGTISVRKLKENAKTPPPLPARPPALPAETARVASPSKPIETPNVPSEMPPVVPSEAAAPQAVPPARVATEAARVAGAAEPQVRAEQIREVADQPATTKAKINVATGVRDLSAPVSTTEKRLLNLSLRAQARGAKAGQRIGRIERAAEIRSQLNAKKAQIKANKTAVIEYARDVLDKSGSDRVKLIAQRATTPSTLRRAMNAIDNLVEKADASRARTEFGRELKSLNKAKLLPEFRKMADDILADFDQAIVSPKKQLRLKSLKNFIKNNPDNNVPERLVNEINRLDKISIGEMDADDVRSLSSALESIRSQSTLKRNILIKQQNRPVFQHADEFMKQLPANAKPVREIRPGLPEAKGGVANKFRLASMNLESLLHEIDGGKTGVASDIVFRDTIKSGQEARERANAGAAEFVIGKLEAAGIPRADIEKWSQPISDSLSEKRTILRVGGKRVARRLGNKAESVSVKLDSGETLSLTYGEAARLWRLSKNARAIKNLLDQSKGGIRIAENEAKLFKLTSDDLERIFAKLPQQVKTAADINHEYENTVQKELLNATSRKRIGTNIATEEDYVRAIRSKLDTREKGVQVGSGPNASPEQQALDGRGFLKEKSNVRAPLVIVDEFNDFFHQVRNVNHYVGMAEPLAIAKAFLSKNNVRQAITREYGKNMMDALDKSLREIENPPRVDDNVITRSVERARQNVTKAVLGAGGVLGGVAAKQPVSYILASTEIAPRYLRQALAQPLPSVTEVANGSAILGSRISSGRFERDVGSSDSAASFWTNKKNISDRLMAPSAFADALAIRRIWTAAKLEVAENNPNLDLNGSEGSHIIGDRAEEIVRKTQPVFAVEDRSGIARSRNELVRLATSFTSQLNQNAQMIVRATNQYKGSARTIADKSKLASDLTSIMIVAPFLIAAIDTLRDKVLKAAGVKRTKKHSASTAAKLAYRTLQNNLNSIYVAGPVLSATLDKAMGEQSFSPQGINNIVAANLATASQGAGGIIEDTISGKWDEKTLKDAKKLGLALSNMTTGLPIGPVTKDINSILMGTGVIEGEHQTSARSRSRRR